MAGGLTLGYGMFVAMAGQYLFPSGENKAWMFVADLAGFPPGGSLAFESPGGVKAVITRKAEAKEAEPSVEDFLALSSVCPHLGCRVHWELAKNRFFCPCHNGEFDPAGNATGGPPAQANQKLARYPLKIEHGMLLIEMPLETLGRPGTLGEA